jgi:hypothetical protein
MVELNGDDIVRLDGAPVPVATPEGPGGYVVRTRDGELKIVCAESVCNK